ncbi:hypothetical protein Anas_10927, partial [Armadillidium nasatum]
MDKSTPSRRRSSLDEEREKRSVSKSRKIKGKRKLEDLGHVFEPARKCRRRISSMEQKLLKIHGISSEARVNLRRLKPPDIKILSQKCVSEEEDIVERNKDIKSLLNEESGERCTINEVSELVVDDASVNGKSDDLCDMSILSENIESNGKKNEIQAQETPAK